MSDAQIREIELSMDAAKEKISLAESLDKLRKNRDFKKIIEEGYFKNEAVRLVHMKGYPSEQRDDLQQAIIRDIDAIGSLRSYLDTIYREAEWAESAIHASEAELALARDEEI